MDPVREPLELSSGWGSKGDPEGACSFWRKRGDSDLEGRGLSA